MEGFEISTILQQALISHLTQSAFEERSGACAGSLEAGSVLL